MHWILQQNPHDPSQLNKIIPCLERLNISYSIHKMIPALGGIIPHVITNEQKIICFGSSYAIHSVAMNQGWNPGVYDIEALDFTVQLEHWGDLMLNADSNVLLFKDVHFEGKMFMRPSKEGKAFNGGIFEGSELPNIPPHITIQLSSIKKIYAEYRLWVIDSHVVASSSYRPLASSLVPDSVVRFAESVISVWNPAKAFVLDVGETEHGMKIIEINTFNVANLYAADVNAIITSIEALNVVQ